jgi:competence protein ComEC
LSAGLVAGSGKGCRCTFLAVGHGCSVLVEAPNGKTLLYDAGAISSGSRACEVILGTLWDRGMSKIDTLVISHADVDHFNAAPDLLRMIPVGSLMVARPFLDFRQSGVSDICNAAAERGVPIHLVWKGDRIILDPAIALDVLHPSLRFHGEEDNENSVVLSIDFAGRRILLTGDLTDGGLSALMDQPSRATDVLLSPHHGSPNTNPPEFAEWAQPRSVVCSKGRLPTIDSIRHSYDRNTTLLSTSDIGAITVDIDPDGTMRVRGHCESPARIASCDP